MDGIQWEEEDVKIDTRCVSPVSVKVFFSDLFGCGGEVGH